MIWAIPSVSWALDRNDARARTDSHLDPGFLQWCAGSNTSDRHMDQSGWTVVSGGAAWGLDSRLQGDTYIYVVLRLDLTTGATTEWLDGPPNRQFAPLGTDNRDRLYVSDGYEVWRLAQPRQVEHLLNPTAEGRAIQGRPGRGDGIPGRALLLSRPASAAIKRASTTPMAMPSGNRIR